MATRSALTALLLLVAVLAWLHYAVADPAGTLAWIDSIAFWGCAGGLLLLWGRRGTRSAARFFGAWRRSDERGLRRLLILGTVAGLAGRFFLGGGLDGTLSLAVLLACGSALLALTAQRDLRRWRAGLRRMALKWFLLAGFLLSYAWAIADLILSDGPAARPAMRTTLLFLLGLVAYALAQLVVRVGRPLSDS